VSTINALETTIGRRHLNARAFLNDPDVFIIRSKNNKLTVDQRYTLLLINLIFGGLVFTSDNIGEYTDEELRLYRSIFPIKQKTVHKVLFSDAVKIYFAIDGNEYLALSNLKDRKAESTIEDGEYYSREKRLIAAGTGITLEPYQSMCLLKAEGTQPVDGGNLFML
jgi:alpha-galactosidase